MSYLSGDDFPYVEYAALNREEPGWKQAVKVVYPDGWYLREDGGHVYLGLKTPPLVAVGTSSALSVPYVAAPADLSADADEPFTQGTDVKKSLRPWHQALVHYAAALLEPLRKNYQGEQRQRTLFAGHVADYLQRKRPKGGGVIAQAKNYYRDARAGRLTGVWGTDRF